jgi:hypothetical protein
MLKALLLKSYDSVRISICYKGICLSRPIGTSKEWKPKAIHLMFQRSGSSLNVGTLLLLVVALLGPNG